MVSTDGDGRRITVFRFHSPDELGDAAKSAAF